MTNNEKENFNTKRKFSINAKANGPEYRIFLSAYEKSDYNTPGHFARDLLIKGSIQMGKPSLYNPAINRETAIRLFEEMNNLNQTVKHLNKAATGFKKLSDEERYQELKKAMSFVADIGHALRIWASFLRNDDKDRKSILNIAAVTLTLKEVNQLQKVVKQRVDE
ncbi:MAG: hypothetical protein GY775_06300 [Candidatus Scalindua sp.]|nr:hypothetical protein [Candidatus Scalindua sp.]